MELRITEGQTDVKIEIVFQMKIWIKTFFLQISRLISIDHQDILLWLHNFGNRSYFMVSLGYCILCINVHPKRFHVNLSFCADRHAFKESKQDRIKQKRLNQGLSTQGMSLKQACRSFPLARRKEKTKCLRQDSNSSKEV